MPVRYGYTGGVHTARTLPVPGTPSGRLLASALHSRVEGWYVSWRHGEWVHQWFVGDEDEAQQVLRLVAAVKA
jgi:hypothetical protein